MTTDTDTDASAAKPLRAAILVFLGDGVVDDGDGQVRTCTEYAARNGYEVVSEYRVDLRGLDRSAGHWPGRNVSLLLRRATRGDSYAAYTLWRRLDNGGRIKVTGATGLSAKLLRDRLISGPPEVDVVVVDMTPPNCASAELRVVVGGWNSPSLRVCLIEGRASGIRLADTEFDAERTRARRTRRTSHGNPTASEIEGLLSDFERPWSEPDALIGDYVSEWERGPSARVPSPAGSLIGSPPRSGLPLKPQDEPLPHDGLFIRRNNAFGSRSGPGIVDLIDEGVLIDQTQIRFDDFILSNSGQIPGPPPGEGLAASHGCAGVTGSFRAHEQTTHLLEIALKAADSPAVGQQPPEPLPVNFVFAIDTSQSMGGEKLDCVKTAIRELYDQLRDTDVLGLITFDSEVRTLLRATPKSRLPQDELTRLVGGLRARGATDLNLGIRYGIDEIRRHSGRGKDYVNCLYVFSDGDPTSGETNWIKIRTDIAARIRGDITLSCFGFGSDARMRELEALAGLTGGYCAFVLRPEDVRLALTEELGRRDQLAAINIQLKIDIPAQTAIWHFYGHDLITDPAARAAVREEAKLAGRRADQEYGVAPLPDLIDQEGGLRVFTPDLAFGETYWIVLELQAPPEAGEPGFGTARVQYLDTVTRENRSVELDLSTSGPIPAEAVLAHAVGLRSSEITFYALDDLYQNDRETAKTRLTNHIQVLKAAYAYKPIEQFQDDQITVLKLISLAENLGQPLKWTDSPGSPAGMTMFAMNAFGQVRGGHLTNRPLGMR